MWHAELGKSLVDMWSGKHQRGVQLHDLRDSALVWVNRYGQQAGSASSAGRSPATPRTRC